MESAEDAARAVAAGADRIELCARLDLDGLTPDPAEVERARRQLAVPLVVLVRPRAGNFVYSRDELREMAAACRRARDAGADALALGALRDDDTVDIEAVAELVAAARPLPVCFHRAFDRVRDAESVLELLAAAGLARVLTSGGPPRAVEASARLAALVAQAAGRLTVMPGGGVRAEHVALLVAATSAREVHSSAGGVSGVARLRAALDRSEPDGARAS